MKTSWASLDASQMNSLLSETMREPLPTFTASKPSQALDPFTTGRRPAAVDQSMRAPNFPVPGAEVLRGPFTPNFDQSMRVPNFPSSMMPGPEVLGGPFTPSVADISSAINEVKALNLKEAQVNRELFEQSEQFVHLSKWSSESNNLNNLKIVFFFHENAFALCSFSSKANGKRNSRIENCMYFIFTEIDTPNLQTNGFGPHLLTTPEAMNIAEQSATLIGSVARSIETVQTKQRLLTGK